MYNIYGVNKKRGSYEPLLFQSKSDITFDCILSCLSFIILERTYSTIWCGTAFPYSLYCLLTLTALQWLSGKP